MQLQIEYTTQFKKDLKKAKKSAKSLMLLNNIAQAIINKKPLPSKLKDHSLIGNWKNYRELHIEKDWLLIYKTIINENTVIFVRTGSHSELLGVTQGYSALSMAQHYSININLQASNKNIFYFLYATFIWKKELELSSNITLSPTDLEIIDGIKNEICNYIKIFTPTPFDAKPENYRDDWIYQRDDWICQLPRDLQTLLSRECLKKTRTQHFN